MNNKILDGKTLGMKIRESLKERVEQLKSKGVTPGLGVILVGENPASVIYVNSKEKACQKAGIFTITRRFPAEIDEKTIFQKIDEFNNDDRIHGILVQLPLPPHINEAKTLRKILPEKDVDGFHPMNLGKLMLGEETFVPCTPLGIVELMKYYGINPEGKNTVILGRSNIVGKPLANLLIQKREWSNATVTVCHTKTENITKHTKKADILIAAMGRAEIIKGDMVKRGVVVIDVGQNKVIDPEAKKGYRLVGDVEFSSVFPKAKAITPVPGGVGPMTIAMLLSNTVKSAESKIEKGG
ncbi:bifunctional methylenetetrahydrofolate dehydrogenase/methenyltetrahydrofolate cyclohydrolase FolD [candidate division KSB1 bacterium]|nr:MAG: bifunctional methylenetetrahydrofolate dehydrogenase/methenyltetrahydrofolate cyclohydrolase FolD [candidate division KSB1 bacterium]